MKAILPVVIPLLAAITACTAPGRAERIGTRADGGSIMLSANSDKAWDRARELMNADCDGSYRILGQSMQGAGNKGGVPPATPSAAADPVGPAGATFGLRVDYECIRKPAPVPLPLVPPGSALSPSPAAG